MTTIPTESAFGSSDTQYTHGLTKREYIAAAVMAGLAADSKFTEFQGNAAEIAVAWADALIAELNRPKPESSNG